MVELAVLVVVLLSVSLVTFAFFNFELRQVKILNHLIFSTLFKLLFRAELLVSGYRIGWILFALEGRECFDENFILFKRLL